MKAERYELEYNTSAFEPEVNEGFEPVAQMRKDEIGQWVQAYEYEDLWELAQDMRDCIDGDCADDDCFGCIHCSIQAIMGDKDEERDN